MDPSQPVTVDALLAQRGWVRALARTLVFDETRADDAEQDAWLAALKSPPRGGGSLRAWFANVVRTRVRDRHRVDVHRAQREFVAARPEATPSAADVAATTEIHRRLTAALLALEEPYRSAVILRYFEDLPPREVAARTGVPVETARTRVKRGIERLRERLDDEHGGDRRAWCALVGPLGAGTKWRTAVEGGAIVATKKTAVLAAILLLALGAGVVSWVARDGDARHVVSDAAGAVPRAETARPKKPARATPDETTAGAVAVQPAAPKTQASRGSVLVVDAETKMPLSSAQIVVAGSDGTTMWGNGGGGGLFSVDPRPAFAKPTVWAMAPGYAWRRLTGAELGKETLTVELRRADPIRLRFVTDGGRVLDTAQVFERSGGGVPTDMVEVVAADALSGGDVSQMLSTLFGTPAGWRIPVGSVGDATTFRLTSGLSDGRWRLFIRRPGATPWLSDPFIVDGSTAPTVTIPLPESPQFRRVRLVADDTKDALAGARVEPWYEYGDDQAFLPGATVDADEQGIASLPWDPPASRQGRRPPTWWARAPGRAGVVPASALDDASGDVPVDVAVPRSVTIEGEAYRPSGEPAAGSRVVTARKGFVERATVGADGRFRMSDVPAFDGAVDAMLLVGDSFFQTRAPVGADGVAHAVIGTRAVPGTRGRITGRVTVGGVPLAGAFAVDQPVNAKGSFVRTDDDGRFVLDGLDVAVEHDFVVYPADPRASDDFRVRTTSPLRLDAQTPRDFAFDLPSGAIGATVVDADTEKPLPGARVSASPADRSTERARFAGFDFAAGWAGYAGEDGSLLLRALTPGAAHKVSAVADGYEASERDAIVPGTLSTPARVELRLTKKR